MRARRPVVAGALAVALALPAVLAGCASSGADAPRGSAAASTATTTPTQDLTQTPAPTPTVMATASTSPSAAAVSTTPIIASLTDAQWARMVVAGVWRPGCPIGRAGLRRVELPYVGFDGRTHRGALVVNVDVASSVERIFLQLYRDRFPVRRMSPIEAYGGDDNASMAADNTSAFNCRQPGQANAPSARSPHANGRAVDLNPYENPWVDPRCQCFQPDSTYGMHRSGAGVIVKGGPAWRAFTHEGWIWQDSTTTDYQHFDTGYPSAPLSR